MSFSVCVDAVFALLFTGLGVVCCYRAGAMTNIKANVPRTAYRGIVTIWRGDKKVHITPVSLTEERSAKS